MARKNLLTQNSNLRALGIHNWTLPAWVTRLPDGRNVNVCPQAGACVKLCYARNGTYNFANVKAAHQRNLATLLDDMDGWMIEILDELNMPRFKARPDRPHLPDLPRDHLSDTVTNLLDTGAPLIRIHDSGDFFSDEYIRAWAHIASLRPDVLFYAYTKEVSRARDVLGYDESLTGVSRITGPENFLLCFSLGGKQDHLLDLSEGGDQHTDVFPSRDALLSEGYYPQTDHDLLSVVAPTNRVGIQVNNIPHVKKKMDGKTFGEVESEMTRHGRK